MDAVSHAASSFLQPAALALYWLVLSLLSVYGLHRIVLVARYLRHRRTAPREPGTRTALPSVTVQLPLYNEANVARRLLEATNRLRYPRHLLDVQVLDDSTDETRAIVDDSVKRLQPEGLRVEVIRRQKREGFKAGALAAGIERATGDVLLVLDADFVPPPDLLERAVGHFDDPRVGMVQARWGHLNEGRSRLTRTQALMLDGHFMVEHSARSLAGCFFNFNGTAGLWRRDAIVQSGGWQSDTLTEDLDLSYRAQLAGWKFIYRPDLVVPAELPEAMTAFKGQQHRWAQGGVETAKKLGGEILRAPLSWRVKLEAFFHLSANVTYVLIVLLGLLLPVTLWRRDSSAAASMAGLAVFAFGTVGLAAFYLVSRARWRTLLDVPALLALGVGVSISQTTAVFAGALGRSAEFVRTPKRGGERIAKPYRPRRSRVHWLEIGMALYAAATAAFAIRTGAPAALPLALLYALGFGWVGISSALDDASDAPALAQADGAGALP